MIRKKSINTENIVRGILFLSAITTVLILLLIVVFLFKEGLPLFSKVSPIDFIFGTEWDPDKNKFGAFNFIVGSIMVTLGAMIIAIPLSLACAIFLSEVAPRWARNATRPAIELLAGIPSIVYALITIVILVSFVRYDIGDFLTGKAFTTGGGIFATSLILAVMILPITTSVSQDSIESVPRTFKEGSYALGSTKWQTIKGVIVPTALPGIVAGSILGMGRAIGETIVVIFVFGNVNQIPTALFGLKSLGEALTSTILLEMGYVPVGSLWYSALFSLGIILLFIVFILSLTSSYILSKNRLKI